MRSFGDLASYSYYKNLALVLSVWKSIKGDLPKAMQGVCDTSGEQILMSEMKYIIQASYLFGKDKIQLWLSCLALEQGKKKKSSKQIVEILCDQAGQGSENLG